MLIPYPFALLSAATAFEVGASLTSRSQWSQTARHMTTAGLGTAVVAALPGVVDYFGSVPPRTSAHRTATQHALCNVSALACFGLAQSRRPDEGRLPAPVLLLMLAGTGFLALGGWLGGELVYRERIGVDGRRARLRDARMDPEEGVASEPSGAVAGRQDLGSGREHERGLPL
jgi:uncharacterized membrane protein